MNKVETPDDGYLRAGGNFDGDSMTAEPTDHCRGARCKANVEAEESAKLDGNTCRTSKEPLTSG